MRIVVACSIGLILALLAGCILSEHFEKEMGHAAGKAIVEGFERGETLKFLVSYYYRKERSWPTDRGQLEQFIADYELPLSLEPYEDISLVVTEDILHCSFTIIPKSTARDDSGLQLSVASFSSYFQMSKEEAMSDNRQIFTPKAPTRVESRGSSADKP